MTNIEKHLINYAKTVLEVSDDEINNLSLSYYMDSLEIVDMICDIEMTYGIEIGVVECDNWPDLTIKEIAEYLTNQFDLE
jgi:acyl carrier protein